MMKYAMLLAAAAGCYAQNIQSLTAEILRAPTAALYVERAAAYLTAGDARGALADTDRALDRDALNVRALTLRGQANLKLGRFSNTISDLSGAIALAPTDASLYVARSEAYAAAGDQPRALADRNEALRLDPSALDKKPAVVVTPTVIAPEPVVVASAPAPAPVKTVVAPVAAPVKAPPLKSATAAEVAPTATTPMSAEAHYQRAKQLLNDRKTSEAVAEMNEAIALQPSNAVYFNTRGYANYLAKNIKEALKDYDEAIRLNPEYLNATHNRALARKNSGDAAGAAVDRQREIELGKKQGVKVQ